MHAQNRHRRNVCFMLGLFGFSFFSLFFGFGFGLNSVFRLFICSFFWLGYFVCFDWYRDHHIMYAIDLFVFVMLIHFLLAFRDPKANYSQNQINAAFSIQNECKRNETKKNQYIERVYV